jgi:O-antigen/teichoic acid export membrane protein
MAANFACLLWICFLSKPWMMPRFSNFRTAYLGKIFRSGMLFFLTQIAGLVVMNSDNLVISHFLSPAQVTPYNVTWRLTNYGSSLLSLITPALWPAYAEAFVKGEQHWMRQAYLKSQRVTLLVLGAVALVMGLTGKFIINIWAGPKAVPSTSLLVLMCIWMIIFGVTMNQSTLIGATGRVGKQAIYALVASASNLALSMWWVQTLGLTGVILGTLVSYLIFIVPFQGWQVRGILKPSQPPAPREGLNHA